MKKVALLRKFTAWRRKGNNNYYVFVFASVVVGFFTGLGAVILKNSVHYVHKIVHNTINDGLGHIGYFIFPFLGLILTYIYLKITKLEIRPGIPNLLYSISRNSGYMKPHNIFSSIIGSILTVGFGGPVGLESPNITTGGGIASAVARYFKLSYRQRILLLGVASAGTISAIFKAPLTGIVFALEVIMIDLTTMFLLPIVLASVTASLTSFLFLGTNYLYTLDVFAIFRLKEVPYYILMGIFTGFFGLFFSTLYKKSSKIFAQIKRPFLRILPAAISIGLLVWLFPSIFAEGYDTLNAAIDSDYEYLFENPILYHFQGNELALVILFLTIGFAKAFGTSITVASGGIGGFFTPILFTGANIGLFFAHFFRKLGFDFSNESSALVAMGGLIAAMLHAPLTSVFFVGELTGGYSLLVPLLITCSISYLIIKIFQKHNFFSETLAKQKILLTHHADHNILTMLNMKELIETNFITVKPTGKLRDLVEAVKISKRDLFPVVDCENNFLGVVSLNRIRKIMFKHELYDKIKITDLMIFPGVHVEINEHLEDVAEKFEKTQKFNLVVLDKGKYIGFLSRSNFFVHYRKLLREFSSH